MNSEEAENLCGVGQVEIEEMDCAEFSPCEDDDDENARSVLVSPYTTCMLARNQLEYACQFYVDPKVQEYYYIRTADAPHSTTATGRVNPNPVLYSCPEFEGGFEVRWQVLICLDRWIGTTRWVSLYLSRVPTGREVDKRSLGVQCELRIVDKDRKVLKKLRNYFTTSFGPEIYGFTKYMQFSEALKMIDNNFLRVEAHMSVGVFY